MKELLLLFFVLFASTLFGLWHKKTRGDIRSKDRKLEISSAEVGEKLGSRITLLQFSSAFCSPCRTTKVLLKDLTASTPDVKPIDVDAESHLELARKLNILSTPTTIVLDADGREVGRAVGVPKRDQVLNLLEIFEI